MYLRVYILRVSVRFFSVFIHSFLFCYYFIFFEWKETVRCVFLSSTGIYAIHLKSGTYKKSNSALIIVLANFTEQHTISVYIDSFSNTRYKNVERSRFLRNKIKLATLGCFLALKCWNGDISKHKHSVASCYMDVIRVFFFVSRTTLRFSYV